MKNAYSFDLRTGLCIFGLKDLIGFGLEQGKLTFFALANINKCLLGAWCCYSAGDALMKK